MEIVTPQELCLKLDPVTALDKDYNSQGNLLFLCVGFKWSLDLFSKFIFVWALFNMFACFYRSYLPVN